MSSTAARRSSRIWRQASSARCRSTSSGKRSADDPDLVGPDRFDRGEEAGACQPDVGAGPRARRVRAPVEGLGGYKEAIASINGRGVFARLKFESGVHRVQRVPATESGGRIHTSAATVAVLPEAEDVDIQIDERDLRIDVYRSSGPGGQSVNTTDSAVRITHLPTGLVVIQQDEKSQHKNKAKALKVLRTRLFELERERLASERAGARKSMVGSGDRSERIRTYNFPQGRVTDHRINLTRHNLDEVLQGPGIT